MIKSILIICLSFFWIIRSLKQLFCHTVSHFLFILAYPKYSTNSTISLNLIICVICGPNCLHLFFSHGFHRFRLLIFLVLTNPCIRVICGLYYLQLFLPHRFHRFPQISSPGILFPTYLCNLCHPWALFLPLILVPQISQIYTDFVTWHSLS